MLLVRSRTLLLLRDRRTRLREGGSRCWLCHAGSQRFPDRRFPRGDLAFTLTVVLGLILSRRRICFLHRSGIRGFAMRYCLFRDCGGFGLRNRLLGVSVGTRRRFLRGWFRTGGFRAGGILIELLLRHF